MRLISVGRFYGAENPFADMFKSVVYINQEADLPYINMSKDDVVLFGGGEDIAPAMYNQKPSLYCRKMARSRRDELEEQVFEMAVKNNAAMLGICRGAQLVCALSGGSLVQHVSNHAGRNHIMTTDTGEDIEVCSVHHQMMNPFSTKHELIGWAKHNLSACYIIEHEENITVPCEPEVVFFPETKALGIQYHPEFMLDSDRAVVYAREIVKQYLMKE